MTTWNSLARIASAALPVFAGAALLSSAVTAADFYEGKRISLVVAFAPGGTADTDGRLISQHLGKHIPGNPTVVVQNSPGAGGITAINVAYQASQPDGLSIYQLASGHYLQQLAGSSVVKFDVSKMPVLGSWTRSSYALVVRADRYPTLESIRNAKEPPRIGSSGIGTGTYLFTMGWQSALGLKFNMVTGYESAQEDLAIERGEIDGRTNSAESILRSKPDWINKNFAPILVMNGPERDPQVPNVPTVYEYNKNPGAFFETINEGLSVARPYVLSPGTPADRVAILRKAWQAMLTDQAFIDEVKRLRFNYVPTPGEKLDAFYRKVVTSTPPEVIASLKEIFP
jgi:tripartite-type tricarboxylate transporter receptor subunit TctC